MSHSEQPGDRWWQFIAYRRRYVSDRTWFGAAFAVAFGAAAGTPTGMRLALRRTGLYLGLIDTDGVDDGLTYRQRLRTNWRRQLRASWPEGLWFLIVIIVASVARWYITALVAVGLGAASAALGNLWRNHRHPDAPADTACLTEHPPTDR